MHFYALIPFALILWWPDDRPFPFLLTVRNPAQSLLVVFGQISLLALIGLALRHWGTGVKGKTASSLGRVQHAHHLSVWALRGGAVLTFAVDMFMTGWPEWVRTLPVPEGWGLDELIILAPFFVSILLGLMAMYPLDSRLRRSIAQQRAWEGASMPAHWTLATYLDFQLRHQILVVAVPMLLITVVHDLTRSAEPWLAYVVMTVSGAVIFLLAPLLLRHVWSTTPLPGGPLRGRLERLSRRIGLRFREILVWRSEGMMVNAAVMGLTPQVRYVLLSDGMLATMSDEQIEAVFGHEAGHIRHHHITFFVLFAVLGTMIISGIMELLLRLSERGQLSLSLDEISVIGFFCMVVIWGIGFGWVSRRFEAQADVFGAQCASPVDDGSCARPCSVHPETNIFEQGVPAHGPSMGASAVGGKTPDVLCASGAEVFRSALEKVALMNGIPLRERSWRHGSIAFRLHALSRLAGDPRQVQRFNRLIRRLKWCLLIGCTVGLFVLLTYVTWHPVYRAELERPLKLLGLR